jgi:hypothetical protein
VRTIQRGSIFIVALALIDADANAETCSPPTPTCHLEAGKQLLPTDPRRASEELLASYKLDERTDTLVLYAQALERDKRFAAAVEAWQRVITYRESELVAAKETGRSTTTARRRLAQATDAVAKLNPLVARVRIKFGQGPKPTVTRDGMEVDATREIVINAGGDELVFARNGASDRVAITLKPGDNVRIDAPDLTAIAAKPKLDKPVAKAEPKKPAPMPIRRIDTRPQQTDVAIAKPKAEPKPMPKLEPKPEPIAGTEAELDKALATTEGPRSTTLKRVGLGVMAGGVAATALAGTFGYLWYRDFDRAKDLGCTASGDCPIGEATDLAERSNDRARIAQISAIGAGALLATGAALYLYGNKRVKREAPVIRTMTLTVSPSSATFAWRF